MTLPHFFINSDSVKENSILITDKDNYVHIAKSLRARVGEKILLIDENQIQYETIITNITSNLIEAKIEKKYKSQRDLKFDLFLAQSPLRSDAQNIIIEKATELGVKGVYPVITDNCALNKQVIKKKIPKWQRIMYEASKQCERAVIPKTFDEMTLSDLIENNQFDKVIAFCERKTKKSLREFINCNPIKKGDKILIIIGPEGGFSEREFKYFEERKIPMITLGDLILKAETAAVVALGNIIYEFQNNR